MFYHKQRDGRVAGVDSDLVNQGAQPKMCFSRAGYDRDGRVDFALTYWGVGHRLFQNDNLAARMNNWIAFDLQGGGGIDRDAIGTRVRVDTVDGLSQIREVKSGSSLGAGNELALHFGLGDSQITRVLVSWLNGDYHEYTRVAVNQRCLITPEMRECENQPPSQ